jgi:SAM-dependent methyltransferase
MRERFAQEKLSNVKVVRSSLWTLPFAPGSMDLVSMNGVLEWVAQGRAGDPAALQERALNNVLRMLRPGGYFYLGIENRLGLGYFAGYRDPHCGLPYVTVLPRPLAHWYSRRRGQPEGYRNYLYSSWGYRKLLQRAGFSDVQVYLALPSYNHPRYLIPLEGNLFSFYSRTFNSVHASRAKELIHDLLLKSGMLKYFEYSFAILARK